SSDLHSFPTRRSSDLIARRESFMATVFSWAKFLLLRASRHVCEHEVGDVRRALLTSSAPGASLARIAVIDRRPDMVALSRAVLRSEEHTSELQSPCNL